LLLYHKSIALLGLSEIDIRKIEVVTEGLHKYIDRELTEEVSTKDAITIANFILAQKTEINLADTYRKTFINVLTILSKFLKNKLFKGITREDILLCLDSLRKHEASDPLHKWVGPYNVRRQQFIKFFKWLYYPNVKSDQRPISAHMHDIPKPI
jgi:integrase/recombinase XerD